jgi:hypothetical protein
MARSQKSDDQYSDEEAERRLLAALLCAAQKSKGKFTASRICGSPQMRP